MGLSLSPIVSTRRVSIVFLGTQASLKKKQFWDRDSKRGCIGRAPSRSSLTAVRSTMSSGTRRTGALGFSLLAVLPLLLLWEPGPDPAPDPSPDDPAAGGTKRPERAPMEPAWEWESASACSHLDPGGYSATLPSVCTATLLNRGPGSFVLPQATEHRFKHASHVQNRIVPVRSDLLMLLPRDPPLRLLDGTT